MGDGGKGSAPRPLGIDWDKFEENWNEIFGNDPYDGSNYVAGNDAGVQQGDCGGAQHSPEHKSGK